jgi:hypothetical protein
LGDYPAWAPKPGGGGPRRPRRPADGTWFYGTVSSAQFWEHCQPGGTPLGGFHGEDTGTVRLRRWKLIRKVAWWTSGTGTDPAAGGAGGNPLLGRRRFPSGPPGGRCRSTERGRGREGPGFPRAPLPLPRLFPDPLCGRYLSATRVGGTRTTGLRGFGPTALSIAAA